MATFNPNMGVAEFDHRHGGQSQRIEDAGWIYYSDGAIRGASSLGELREPSADPYERAQTICHYWKLKSDAAVNDFNELKANLAGCARAEQRKSMPPPPPDTIAQLQALRDRARDCLDRAEAARLDMESKIPERDRQRDARRARNVEECETYFQTVNEINL